MQFDLAFHSGSRETVYVNMRYLARPVTGVERFANGVLAALDAGLTADEARSFVALAPVGVTRPPWLRNLGFRTVGRWQGHLWEQTELYRASREGRLVNLCNSGPVLHARQLTVLHDALVYRHPENFSLPYRSLHRTLGRLLARRSHLVTVSSFSRRELSSILGVGEGQIGLVPNAVDHMASIDADGGVVKRLGLEGRPFLLFVGSPASNKNLAGAIRAFVDLDRQDAALVLVGNASGAFARTFLGDPPPNVVAAGRLSDEEVKALYGAARALVFPSVYEGFGIPPLEALSQGCPVIASRISVVEEVCGDAALYFDPRDQASIRSVMTRALEGAFDEEVLREAGLKRVERFSWERSARTLLALIDTMGGNNEASRGPAGS